MDLSSAVQWWQEWQLRILVLVSLFFYFFLYYSYEIRSKPNLRRLRALVWIAYVGSDAIAIYALATLFNRRKEQQQTRSGLEVIWAPILLIHLGGHTQITSLSLEDNELWKRHVITLVSQITVALYVFCKWWSGERKNLLAAALLFIVGIIKFSQKPLALRRASFSSIRSSSGMSMTKRRELIRSFARSLEEYVQTAKKYVHDQVVVINHLDSYHFSDMEQISMMLVDLSAPYSARLSELQSFLKLDDKCAFRTLHSCLKGTFVLLYTRKLAISETLCVFLNLVVLPLLTIASLVLFARSHKDGYSRKDVKVTYILVCFTVVIDFLPLLDISTLFIRIVNPWLCQRSGELMVSQHSVMAMFVRRKQPTLVMKLAIFNDYVDKCWYVWEEPVATQITRLVHKHVKDGWNKYIHDAASYRRFSELRGQQSLRRHHRLLGWSLQKPFDESVLLWHIATDLCFHLQDPADTTQGGDEEIRDATRRGREISNYMIYLLFVHPELLMPGTRWGLFSNSMDDIEGILKDSKVQPHSEQTLAREIIDKVNSSATGAPAVPVAQELGCHIIDDVESPAAAATAPPTPVHNACRLATALMELDDKERWTMIQGVWLEMLCYSASGCRGYLHAKSVGEGGEYLSIIWFLWRYMGMETLGDRCQRSEPLQEEEEEEKAAASAIGASTAHSQVPT